VGSPTQAWRMTKPVVSFLGSLGLMGGSLDRAAAFDTRTKGWYAGGAVGGIEKRLRQLGLNIIVPGLAVHVAREKTDAGVTWTLVDEELEKVKQFAEKIAEALR
jgi:flavorubredoxin